LAPAIREEFFSHEQRWQKRQSKPKSGGRGVKFFETRRWRTSSFLVIRQYLKKKKKGSRNLSFLLKKGRRDEKKKGLTERERNLRILIGKIHQMRNRDRKRSLLRHLSLSPQRKREKRGVGLAK